MYKNYIYPKLKINKEGQQITISTSVRVQNRKDLKWYLTSVSESYTLDEGQVMIKEEELEMFLYVCYSLYISGNVYPELSKLDGDQMDEYQRLRFYYPHLNN